MNVLSALVIRDVAIAVERLHNPDLHHTPLILLTGNKRLKVLAADPLARQAGVEVGQTRKQAELLCPTATAFRAREEVYRHIFMAVTSALLRDIAKIEPKYQPTNALWFVNTAYPQELAVLRETIHAHLGLNAAVGSASTKFVARVAAATAIGPTYQQMVAKGEEPAMLAPYPVTLLPLNKDMQRRLPMMGIHTMGEYAALTRVAVFEQWGRHGSWCHDLACGIDPRPLQSYVPPPVLTQIAPFDDPITDREILMATCLRLAPLLIHQLNQREAGRVVLSLICADSTRHEVHLQPSVPIRDIAQFQRQLPHLLEKPAFTAGVTHLTLQFAEIQPIVPTQLSLFDFAKQQQSLDKAVTAWQDRFHETVYQPTLTDVPRLFPPELQVEYTAVSA